MLVIDYVALALIILFIGLGLSLGLGKGLKFFTSGIFGLALSIFITYLILGFVLGLPFVQKMVVSFNDMLASKNNWFTDFLLNIGIIKIIIAIALVVIIQILRMVIVSLIARGLDSENKAVTVINKTFGVIFCLAYLVGIYLVVMQIIYAVDGASGSFYNSIKGSFFKLDELYLNNPLNLIFQKIKG